MSISRYKCASRLSERAQQEAAVNLVTTGYTVAETAKILCVTERRVIWFLRSLSSDYEPDQCGASGNKPVAGDWGDRKRTDI